MTKKVSNTVMNITGMFRHQNAVLLIKIYHDSVQAQIEKVLKLIVLRRRIA